MREVNKVTFQSPPRPKKLTSTFEASCGLSVDDTKSHTSFPQSNHMSNSLQIINDGIVANESQFSSVSGFGLASFTEQFRSKDYDIFYSTLVIRGGLTLQFKEQPPLSPVPIPLSNTQDPQKFLLLSTEVETLLTKRAVEEVPVSSIDPGFYSRLFLVSKKTGGMRPVIDLSILNSYMIIPHFKMETNRSIRASILPGMWTTSLDLTDAYFHVPVCHSYRKFLRFVWNKRVYQFRALSFGLQTAPLALAKLMQVAIAHLHSQAFQIHSYLDDSLIKELSRNSLNTDVVIRLLLSLGFLISWKKSDLIPSQDFIFLGEHYLTRQCIVRPPQEKFQNLCSKNSSVSISKKTVTARQFSQLLGLLNSLADVVPLGRLHIRPLQFYLHQHWLPATQDWEFPVPIIHQELFPHLVWWTSQANVLRGQLLSSPVPNQTHVHSFCYRAVLFQSRKSSSFCNHLHLQIVVRHVPGKLNVLADARSRTLTPVNTEWEQYFRQ
ncbi:Hypothetical predicted protein [Mytilus galloprovincialis]|uniref:Reverse transcriptase domain-containing protein n=1 Tax=Mytilus galloprovincialis TaxID=29158 RepID=A0A8B6CWF7_MYTGA|nr:Hypothetical predicted protein [Mytilus galloprovincialis]